MPVVKDIYKLKEINVLYVVPNETPKEISMPLSQRTLKELLHGPLKVISLDNVNNVCALCNANGNFGRMANRVINDSIVYDNFIIARLSGKNNYKSLTKDQISKYTEMFGYDSIKRLNNKIKTRLAIRSILRKKR